MKKMIYLVAIALTTFTNAYAVQASDVTEGAQAYDWQTCIDRKTDDCVSNICSTSSDIDCDKNCKSMANDKCLSEGLSSPQ